jgi:hypothetical protein
MTESIFTMRLNTTKHRGIFVQKCGGNGQLVGIPSAKCQEKTGRKGKELERKLEIDENNRG